MRSDLRGRRVRDFTLDKYDRLCEIVSKSVYTNVTFQEYATSPRAETRCIILRHDIDEDCRYALDLARVEHEHRLRATYYFRVKKRAFCPDLVRQIADLGHEIGYHYETVDRCGGDMTKAIQLFEDELAELRRQFPVQTACMHGNPLTRHDNKDIWRYRTLRDFDLVGEPYLTLDYSKFAYFSDSGRSWSRDQSRKAKDVVAFSHGQQPRDTDDLMKIIADAKPENICILTHPERWPKSTVDYGRRWFIDMAYNAAKKLLLLARRVM